MAHEISPARWTAAKRRLWGSTLLLASVFGTACAGAPAPAAKPVSAPRPSQPAPLPTPAELPQVPVVNFRLGEKIEIRTVPSPSEFPKLLAASELQQRFLPLDPRPGLWAMLDQHPARSFAARKLKYSDLLNEDEELAPGFHWVSLFQESAGESFPLLQFSLVAVAVDSEPEGMPLAPGCALLWPVGTYNGLDAAANIRVLAVPRQNGVTSVQYEARSGTWVSQGRFKVGQVLLLDSPPDGDVEVSATCMVEEESLSMTTNTITINSDTAAKEVAP